MSSEVAIQKALKKPKERKAFVKKDCKEQNDLFNDNSRPFILVYLQVFAYVWLDYILPKL